MLDAELELKLEAVRQNVNYKDLARKMHISDAKLYKVFTDPKRSLTVTELVKGADALNVKTSELFRRAEEAEKSCPHSPNQ